MSSLRLFLLGPPRLERDGVPLEFDTHKNVALVAYLALTGKSHSRETLVTLLWPELAPERARAGLRRNLSALRKSLGGEWLVIDRETVSKDAAADLWCDVEQFHALLQVWQKHHHSEGQDCSECLAALANAVGLYCEDFMAGFSLRDSAAFDEWQSFQTESLRQELAAALERLVWGYSHRGEFERAIPYARRWVTLDPLHEPAQRWLMRLYAQAGQRAAALHQYQECVRVLRTEVNLPPSEETTHLHEQIRAGQVGHEESSIPQLRHNLPAQSTRFIGQQAALTEIRARLQEPDCRLLTLVGPGGSGKTRLAQEVAASLIDQFEHGIFFVPLAPLQTVEAMAPAVARSIGLSFSGVTGSETEVEPRQQLLDYLRRKHMLLILDNLEHLVQGVGLVTEMLDAAPHVRILATSRARLNLQGEHLFPVAGLSLSDNAVELFVVSARRVRPGFGLTSDNMADVVRLCRLVEGMPLAILLAAAWAPLLSPAAIADQVGHSIDFLASDLHDLPERQHSMRAVFDHSWTWLTPRLRVVMQASSVFRGGFTWQAAQHVAGASLHELRTLVDRSLLHPAPGDRFEMHELLRQYAEEKLEMGDSRLENGTQPPISKLKSQIYDRHCDYYVSALKRWAVDLKGSGQRRALIEMDAETENMRTAWNWAVTQGQVERLEQAMEALCLFYFRRGRFEEGVIVCRAPAESRPTATPDDGSSVRAIALAWQSAFEQELGHIELADKLLHQSHALIEELESSRRDMRAARAFVLLRMGEIEYYSDRREAGRSFEQSLALYRALGDRWRTAHVLRALGSIALNVGEYQRAKQLYQESLAIRRALGDPWGIANSLQGLGRVALSLGEIEEGERLVREGIAISEEIGDQAGLVKGLGNLAVLLPWTGRFAEAQAILEKSRAICEEMGFRVGLVYAVAFLSTMKGHLGEYEPARSLSLKCLTLAKEISYSWAQGFSLILLGGVALVEQDYEKAWQFFQESLSVYREAGQQETTGFALVFSAVSTLRLGQPALAWQTLCEALRMVTAIEAFEPSVIALAAVALFLIELGQPERAVELYAAASRYPLVSDSHWYQDLFGRHIAAAAAKLPSQVVAAAQERGRARNLDATLAELLAELGE